ncbi:MAG TPA: pyrimidine-nucleoside phosphorylase [Longilinea sp.]|nr:pyrimidine-nucleoside phosphorylase [Longilinea sp.]
MRAVDVIIKKRDKGELTKEEIDFFVRGYTKGAIPDYQAAAWAMAVLLNGMTDRETTDLTMAMAHSGEVLDLSKVVPIALDKHSTGGVGDKTTLVVEPIVTACGVPVGKMSGRGLGFSGGTLDKMESIPGFRTNLTREEFIKQLREVGLVLTGQTGDLAPADGKLYALRDVTGTVQSKPLIASSVMSKKIAAGSQAILLDVKTGEGAFMKTIEDARELARLMVSIGVLSGRKVVALLSDMNQPLGEAVGNALELKEAIDTLHGKGPQDFREHCLVAASYMLVLGHKAANLEAGRKLAEQALAEGRPWESFRTLVQVQGGDVSYIDQPEKLAQAKLVEQLTAPKDGYLKEVNARVVGETSVELGAGRAKKEDSIDHAVGILVHHKVGDHVAKGEAVFTVHANDISKMRLAMERLPGALQWSDTPCDALPLFYGVIE